MRYISSFLPFSIPSGGPAARNEHRATLDQNERCMNLPARDLYHLSLSLSAAPTRRHVGTEQFCFVSNSIDWLQKEKPDTIPDERFRERPRQVATVKRRDWHTYCGEKRDSRTLVGRKPHQCACDFQEKGIHRSTDSHGVPSVSLDEKVRDGVVRLVLFCLFLTLFGQLHKLFPGADNIVASGRRTT